VISENLSFKDFQMKVATALGIKPAKKEASKLLLEVGWRLDWLKHKLKGKRRKLSRQMAKTAQSKTLYDNSKLKKALNFEYSPIKESINKVSQYFLNDLKK
jgi:hypothetical protein